ncbi:D-amino-acid transaminase [Bosea caraganae]|uniref:Probable branched-chain-amino-acid aminotransferase n=1 Tax=Bosea caraganae TaxID=2763117 RepID=A0A370L3X6_9HYPH|nr:D-amino-acid transaminase [Bosea caraganae]RDJ23040.1 D-amino-acid transaminase [Bosea caraganae]RDJ28820.1 D-amino-acid transaminase [Bosea caraganae]
MSRTVYVNGAYLPEEDAKISIFDRSFIFGDGIYEVSAVIGGKLVDCEAHLARLERSCGEIRLALPWSKAELVAVHEELIKRNSLDEGGIYLQVSRGAADRDFAFPTDATPTLVMFTQERNMSSAPAAKTGIKVVSCPDLRWARRDIKSVNLLGPVLAKQFAAESGAQEAWLVEDGVVTEGASSTAWIVKGKTLISRPLSNKVLPGITRKAVLAYIGETDFTFEERTFTLDEALDAEEVFITSATSLVMPVVQIDGHTIHNGAPGPTAIRLREIYLDFAKKGGALG